jgi:hypothetical protein
MFVSSNYSIKFYHLIPGNSNYEKMKEFLSAHFDDMTAGTACSIEHIPTGTEWWGRSYIHPNDKGYSRVYGRKHALDRALRAAVQDKTQRAEIWADYIDRYKIK